MFLRVACHTIRKGAVGHFHFRTVHKDTLIEIVDLFLQLDCVMISVAFGGENRFVFCLVPT